MQWWTVNKMREVRRREREREREDVNSKIKKEREKKESPMEKQICEKGSERIREKKIKEGL